MIIKTEPTALLGSLTAKQRELLDLLGEGLTSKEIARDLGVSPSAIEQRLRALKEKFGVTSKNELARRCRQLRAPALNVAEQSIIREALPPSGGGRPDQSIDTTTAEALEPPASSLTSLPDPHHLIADARFLVGFVLGFLAGGVVAGASVTFAFRAFLEFI